MQVGKLLLLEIGHLLGEILKISGEQVGVHGHAEHVAALVPFRIGHAFGVETLQIGRSGRMGLIHELSQAFQRFGIAIQAREQFLQLLAMLRETICECFVGLGTCGHGRTPLGNFVVVSLYAASVAALPLSVARLIAFTKPVRRVLSPTLKRLMATHHPLSAVIYATADAMAPS